ncbi:MAG: hypothetical protein HYR79_08940 [Nitrospirae bacterium]|nr:hypothetical protein [Nitrospirota bacterium]
MNKRPGTISIKELSKAVDNAVKIAAERHNVRFSPELIIGPIILGRQILQADIQLKQAEQIATEITQHLAANVSGAALGAHQAEPAVLVRKGPVITIGYIPPEPVWGIKPE